MIKRLFTVLLLLVVTSSALSITEVSATTSVSPKVAPGLNSSYALKSDGTVWAWGRGTDGRLGIGNTTSQSLPVQIPSLSNVIDIAAGESHAVALKADGTVWAWGNNPVGQVGDGTTSDRHTPVQISLSSVIAIESFGDSNLALKSDGTVWGWGSNAYRQLGIGNISSSQKTPVQVHTVNNVVDIAIGLKNGAALSNAGVLWTWGDNNDGQIGDGTTTDRPSPVAISGITSVHSIASGSNNIMALKTDGTLWNWGNEYANGITNIVQYRVPTQIPSIQNVASFSTHSGRVTAIKTDGTMWSFGYNSAGTNGVGDSTVLSIYRLPHQVVISDLTTPLVDMIFIKSGDSHSMAVKADGTVWTWGTNTYGKLGDGTTTNRNYAVQVSGLNLLGDMITLNQSVNVSVGVGESKGFAFVAPFTGTVTFSTSFWQTNCDPMLTLYDSLGNQLAFNDDDPGSLYETLPYSVVAGQTYYIEVSGYNSSAADCVLSVV